MRKLKDLDPLIHILFVVAIAILISALVILQKQVNTINKRLSQQGVEVSSEGTRILFQDCGSECKSEIKKAVSDAIAKVGAVPKTVIKKEIAEAKTSYVPLDGPVSSTSTTWVDVPGVEVYLDLADFSKDAKVSWEASLKVAHANGTAYARLFDVTHGITVLGSEISTTDNSVYKTVTSGNLNLWAGRNLYRLQLKSLNSFEITFSNGRIKISY